MAPTNTSRDPQKHVTPPQISSVPLAVPMNPVTGSVPLDKLFAMFPFHMSVHATTLGEHTRTELALDTSDLEMYCVDMSL